MLRLVAMLLATVLLQVGLVAQAAQVRAIDREQDIDVSVRVETLDGEVLFDWDGDTPRVLASNTKLLTTAAALLALPADYRWQTTVYLDDERLTLVGAGDPSLRRLPGRDVPAEFLDSLAEALREARMESIPTLVLDARAFGEHARHPLWPEEQWHQTYAAGFAGLAIEGGLLEVQHEDGRVRLYPEVGDAIHVERKLKKDASIFTGYWLREDKLLRVVDSPRRHEGPGLQGLSATGARGLIHARRTARLA